MYCTEVWLQIYKRGGRVCGRVQREGALGQELRDGFRRG